MKNNLLTGLLIGLPAPITAYLLTAYTTITATLATGKETLLYMLAGALNLLILRFMYRREYEKVGQGVILITFVTVLLLLYMHKLKF